MDTNDDPKIRNSATLVGDHCLIIQPELSGVSAAPWLSRAVADWFQNNPERRVQAATTIVEDGTTIALHLYLE
jgi:CO/xanthine dehydrogenase FAD-binding subunit